MIIKISRSRGFAGAAAERVFDTRDLSPDVAQEVDACLVKLIYVNEKRGERPAGARDYQVTVEDDRGGLRQLSVTDEGELENSPVAALRQLLDALGTTV